ncbi:MAG: DUF1343 domain-containing protein, partial [Acidimicrobiia bacterium]|nr:DUF1343 domain-containing protein [Acidimicrobiia bacterium]
AGCGRASDGRPVLAESSSTSNNMDSSPGQTLELDGVGQDRADGNDTGSVEANGGRVDADSRSIQPSGGGAVTGASVRIGSSVLVGKDFVNLAGRTVGIIASTASVGPEGHIVDLLHSQPDIEVAAVFSPEHGFSADRPSGVAVADDVDPTTGLTVFSLYGDSYRPTAEMLKGIDVLVYDLQDVGARYYTFISTLGLAMQAAAEQKIAVMVLDRPNPLGGFLVGGAVAEPGSGSLVSLYPIPTIYGMTVGELALAIVGERWLDGLDGLDLSVIPMEGWSRDQLWSDTGLSWTPPSPGLPSPESARVYPSVVLFEATTVSFGQGTDRPFSQIGAPWLDAPDLVAELIGLELPDVEFSAVTFTPEPSPSAPEPRFAHQLIPGVHIEVTGPDYAPLLVGLHLLAAVQRQSPEPIIDRGLMFDLLVGDRTVRRGLLNGVAPEEIVGSWAAGLTEFHEVRDRYLLYP